MTRDPDIRALIEAALPKREGNGGIPPAERRGRHPACLETLERFGHPLPLRQDRALYYQGDAAESAYLLVTGGVRAVKYKSGERTIELPPVGIGAWLGLAELEARAPYRCDAVAAEPGLVLEYSRYNFGLARAEEGFASYIASVLARQVLDLDALLEDESPEEKIVSFLLSRRKEIAGATSSAVSITQEKMARAIGVTRETVNKRLAVLAGAGAVRLARGSIEVTDWEALARRREP
jgi:CRP/FNR family transcriptional regulator, cyclic AMP receptor protein